MIEKIDTDSEDFNIIKEEGDPLSVLIKECVVKINEIIDRVNE